ncbi:MAG: nucleotidyl transferase AbiEii/AbiGii toxin family protein [Planctomycetes bacterium]|nr:nucleotidyl transferase AbiEii/AbiGii toxin family protein [Planctomycetota bacterium]
MEEKLDKALLRAIQAISEKFGPTAVLKGGMALRLQGIPRSTIDADFSFKPFKKKTPFTSDLVSLMNHICDETVKVASDSKKLQVVGMIEGTQILIEASALAEDFDSEPLDTTEISNHYDLPPSIISIMPNSMAFSNKLGAWYDRRLSRDLYDIYVYYDILKIHPDYDILINRILKPNFTKLVKIKPKLSSIDAFTDFIRDQCSTKGDLEIENELEGIIEERERRGIGKKITTTIRRMSLD